MDSHGIYGHGLISWIHSIHDLGSFSFGSGIFLFRIYVLLMSWHTSRILFYCHGFTPWVSFIPGIIGFHEPGCVPWLTFTQVIIDSLDSISWNVAIPGYAIYRIIGIHCHGLISWIHSIHDLGLFSFGSGIFLFRIHVLLMSWHTSRILFYCHGLLLFLESLLFVALDVFLFLLRFLKLLTCVKKDKLWSPYYRSPITILKLIFLTWGYLIKHKNIFIKQRNFKRCFNLNIKVF